MSCVFCSRSVYKDTICVNVKLDCVFYVLKNTIL